MLLLSFCMGSWAQTVVTVTGMVTDDEGLPVIGGNVSEKGTENGTITDLN